MTSDTPPYENAAGYVLDKPVNLAQLTDELEKAISRYDVRLAQLGPNDPGPVSTDNPAQLWVIPADVDTAVLTQVLADHVINPNWGVPQVLLDFSTAMAKLQQDPEAPLTASDSDSLLRGLALQFHAMVSATQGAGDAPPLPTS